MKRLSSVMVLATAIALGGCHKDPVLATETDTLVVSATRVASGIRLTNNTDRGIAYVVSNPMWLGLLGLCADPGPDCVKLAPGASVVIPVSEIHGYSSDATQASVFWWHVVPDGNGGYTQDQVTTVFVQL